MPLSRTAGAPESGSVSGAVGASVAKCLLEQVEPACELLFACRQRREEPNDVPVEAAGEEQQPLLERGRRRGLCGVGCRLAQLEREHRAEPTYLADERLPRCDLLQARAQERSDVLGLLGEARGSQL